MPSKIQIISSGLIFVQKGCFAGLIFGKLIFGGGYYLREFCVSKWVGLDNENSLKHLTIASTNRPWAYIRESLLLEGFLHLRFRGLIFLEEGGGAYYQNFTE